MSLQERAHRATALLRDDVFKEFMAELRRDLANVFLAPSATTEDIAEARDIIMALHKLEGKLHSAVAEGKRDEKRKNQ